MTNTWTKAEKNAYYKRLYASNPEKYRKRARAYYETHKEQAYASQRKWMAKHPEKPMEYKKRWLEKYPEERRQIVRNYHIKLRRAAIEYYGVPNPKCMCPGGCDEGIYEFLAIDHINGGTAGKHGTSAREKDRKGTLYQWLRKHDYPPGYQVLCHNCNTAKAAYGKCPHQK